MKIGFVILHYENINDTINCINTIKEMKNSKHMKINIYLIDNKSPNGTGEKLKKMYKNNPEIKVILMDKNYGFSYSNNVGYKHAKIDKCNLIIVCNNDILFEDKNFLNNLYDLYNNEKKDILIPDVINYNGFHQNPMKQMEYSFGSALKNCLRKIFVFVLLHIPFIKLWVYKREIKREKRWLNNYYNAKVDDEQINEYFVPIGAFIIYGENWILNEELAFPSKTFLYAEEYFLTHYIKKKKYEMKYYKDLKVKHLEGRSTSISSKNGYQKMIMKYKYSIKALIKYMFFLFGGD